MWQERKESGRAFRFLSGKQGDGTECGCRKGWGRRTMRPGLHLRCPWGLRDGDIHQTARMRAQSRAAGHRQSSRLRARASNRPATGQLCYCWCFPAFSPRLTTHLCPPLGRSRWSPGASMFSVILVSAAPSSPEERRRRWQVPSWVCWAMGPWGTSMGNVRPDGSCSHSGSLKFGTISGNYQSIAGDGNHENRWECPKTM